MFKIIDLDVEEKELAETAARLATEALLATQAAAKRASEAPPPDPADTPGGSVGSPGELTPIPGQRLSNPSDDAIDCDPESFGQSGPSLM